MADPSWLRHFIPPDDASIAWAIERDAAIPVSTAASARAALLRDLALAGDKAATASLGSLLRPLTVRAKAGKGLRPTAAFDLPRAWAAFDTPLRLAYDSVVDTGVITLTDIRLGTAIWHAWGPDLAFVVLKTSATITATSVRAELRPLVALPCHAVGRYYEYAGSDLLQALQLLYEHDPRGHIVHTPAGAFLGGIMRGMTSGRHPHVCSVRTARAFVPARAFEAAYALAA